GLDTNRPQLVADQRLCALELERRVGVDEDSTSLVRHRKPVVRELVHELVRVRVEDTEPRQQAARSVLVEFDAKPPVVAGHAPDGTTRRVEWEALVERQHRRYEDGEARDDPEQLVRMGNAAYGAALALLMLGRD